jgi:polyhydroxyalkanoate synthesis regulator phasin
MNFSNNNANNIVYQSQIEQLMADSMRAYGSNNAPYANSNFRLPRSLGAPTMFGQLQGAVGGIFGPEIGAFMGAALTPQGQSILSTFGLADIVNTLASSPPLGGTADPAAFMLSQLNRNIGRGIPRAALPFDFTNLEATDSYRAQQKAYQDYMGTYFGNKVGGTNVQALQLGTQANVGSVNQVLAARNAIALSRENLGFGNAFEVMNAIDKGIDPNAIYTDPAFLAATKSNADAQRYLNDPKNKKLVDRILNNARLASGVVTVGETLSGFVGGNMFQNAEAQALGDFILGDVLQIGNNPQFFQSEVAKTLGNMGVLNTAMGISTTGKNIPAANLIAGRVNEIFNKGDESPFLSTRSTGYNRTRELISSLSSSGLISAGGADVYGSIKQGDIDKIGKSLMTQLEGFSEIVKVGKRVGLKVDEVVKGIDTIYGGRISQTINTKADRMFTEFSQVGPSGKSEADLIVAEEDARRVARGAAPLSQGGASAISDFLRLEAQRKAGREIGAQIAETINVGQFAGFDARGTLAVANTITKMMENIGIGGSGSLDMTRTALAMVGTSAAAGTPITAVQGVAAVTGIMATSVENPSTKAYLALQLAIKNGAAKADDPAVKALLDRYRSGQEINDTEAMAALSKYGVDEGSYMRYRDQGIFDAASYFSDIQANIVQGRDGPVAKMRTGLEGRLTKPGSDAVFQKIETLGGAGGLEGGLLEIRRGLSDGKIDETRRKLSAAGLTEKEINALFLEVGAKDLSVAGIQDPKVSGEVINYFLEGRAIRNRYNLKDDISALELRAGSDAKLSEIMARAAENPTGSSGEDLRKGIKAKRDQKIEDLVKVLTADGKMTKEQAKKFAEENVSLGVAELLEVAGNLDPNKRAQILDAAEAELNSILRSGSASETERRQAELAKERIVAFRAQDDKKSETSKEDATRAEAQKLLNPSESAASDGTLNTDSKGTPTASGQSKDKPAGTKPSTEDQLAAMSQTMVEIKEKLEAGIKVSLWG